MAVYNADGTISYFVGSPDFAYAPQPGLAPQQYGLGALLTDRSGDYDRQGNYIGGDTLLRGGSAVNGSVRTALTGTASRSGLSGTPVYFNDAGPVGMNGLRGSSTRYSDNYWANQKAAADAYARSKAGSVQATADAIFGNPRGDELDSAMRTDANALSKSGGLIQQVYVDDGAPKAYFDPASGTLKMTPGSTSVDAQGRTVDNIEVRRNPALDADYKREKALIDAKYSDPYGRQFKNEDNPAETAAFWGKYKEVADKKAELGADSQRYWAAVKKNPADLSSRQKAEAADRQMQEYINMQAGMENQMKKLDRRAASTLQAPPESGSGSGHISVQVSPQPTNTSARPIDTEDDFVTKARARGISEAKARQYYRSVSGG